jgi:hypothetical protein
MVKNLAQLQQVEKLEPHEVNEVKHTRKIYFIITIEYVPKSSRKLNKK